MLDSGKPYYWQFVEPHWDRVNIYGTANDFLADYKRLSKPVQHLLTCTWCHSEVCNGGFHQFFGNSTGVLAPEAAIGFEAIGLPKAAVAVSGAMHFFGKRFPRAQPVREQRLNEYAAANPEAWNPFEAFDEHFYDALGTGAYADDWEKVADAYTRRALGSQP
ncbi:MAG: DUF4375 domain-containing protein [Hyphomicrobiaceae bacterium]